MRYLMPVLCEFAQEKCVLISGPRQVGKTTLANAWLKDKSKNTLALNGIETLEAEYLSWDNAKDREKILSLSFLKNSTLQAIVFDELHKFQRWKSWLKGLYDKEGDKIEIVVTGSARLRVCAYAKGLCS